MISKANQCSVGVKRLNWICQKVAQSLDPMLSRFSWSEPVRYFISSAIRLKVKLCPQPVSAGAIYRRKKRLGHLVLGSFFQFFSFSPMICEASSPLWNGTYTAFLIHWNTGFSVLKCGLDKPVLFFSQDAQNLQMLISSSCQSCPDAALLGFFGEVGWKNTQYLCCRVITDDGIHTGTMLKSGNVHTCETISAVWLTCLYHVITSPPWESSQHRRKWPESADFVCIYFFKT